MPRLTTVTVPAHLTPHAHEVLEIVCVHGCPVGRLGRLVTPPSAPPARWTWAIVMNGDFRGGAADDRASALLAAVIATYDLEGHHGEKN